MTDFNINVFEELMNDGYNDELQEMETFPPEIQKQIQETYKRLWAEKKKWLESKEKGV